MQDKTGGNLTLDTYRQDRSMVAPSRVCNKQVIEKCGSCAGVIPTADR